ncbi:MAG TPA: hypothetical protein PKJ97_02055 [Candidatus Bilamarchaeaceae archaeon]|nr:hypothetical protein [Candidatus Bilamarchaeaceae archaeon]
MRAVFAVPAGKKKELAALLEADPYAEGSFARAGYKMKDGPAIGESAENIYVYIKADEAFLKKARERLKPLLAEMKKEEEERIAEKIEKEEDAAEGGFGAIFG